MPPGHRVAQALRASGEAPTARLRDELPGAVMLAEGEGHVGRDVVRRAEEIVYETNRYLGLTRKRVVDKHGNLREKITSLDALVEVFDPAALAAYDGVEAGMLLDSLVTRGRLSQRELEALALFRQGFKPQEIAAHLGISSGTVYVLLGRVRTKLATVA